MIHPRYWIKHLVARRALRGYPLYDVPRKQAERTVTETEARENFDYFMSVRLSRLAYFTDWIRKHFAVKATLDGEGLTAVSDWADAYGGGLICAEDHVALNIWATYEPIWDAAFAGFNVMIDIGIFQGEYLIAKRPRLGWEIYRGQEIEPATFDSIQFMKPCLGGMPRFWNGFPLGTGLSAVINGRGLAMIGNHMARRGALITNARQVLHLSNVADGEDPIIIGDYRNETI
jgi:hypothetical protein